MNLGSLSNGWIFIDKPQGITSFDVIRKIRNFNSPILETIILLDLYENEKLGKGKKNATFRFRYRNQNKTIEAEEIETEHKRITQHINKT